MTEREFFAKVSRSLIINGFLGTFATYAEQQMVSKAWEEQPDRLSANTVALQIARRRLDIWVA